MNIVSRGFSIIEAMIAVSLISAISLMIVGQSNQIAKIENGTNSLHKRKTLSQQINSILSNEKNCELNFEFIGKNIRLKNSNQINYYDSIGNIQSIIDTSNHLEKSSTFKITKIEVKENDFGFYTLILQTAIKNQKKHYAKSRPIEIIILTKYDNGIKCSTSYENQIDNLLNIAVLKSCKSPYKIIETKNKTHMYECVLPVGEIHSSTCKDGELLKRVYLENNNGKLEVKTTCIPLSPCENNEIMVIINGVIVCKKQCLPDEIPIFTKNSFKCEKVICPRGQYLRGINESGRPICIEIVDNATKSCNTGIKLIESNGKVGVKCN